MLTSLPSLTVTFLPEQGAVELISDCGLEGTRRISCKGQAVSMIIIQDFWKFQMNIINGFRPFYYYF